MAVFESLKQGRNFTKADEAVAGFILQHADEIGQMHISEVANRSYVSSAAVNRMCRKLGVSGFREFKVELVRDLERLRGTEGVGPHLALRHGESASTIIADLAQLNNRAVSATSTTLSGLELHGAARAVASAGHVVIYASGDSSATSELLVSDLLKIGIVAISAARNDHPWMATHSLRKGDAAVVVSYSGTKLDTAAAHLDTARANGAKIIAVTSRNFDGLAAKPFDFLLQLPEGEGIVGSTGTFFSQACVRYALSCLYATVFSLDMEGNASHKHDIDQPDWGQGS